MKKQIFQLALFTLTLVGISLAMEGVMEWLAAGAVTLAYTMVSVARPGKSAGTPGNKKDRIVIFRWDDVTTYNRITDQAKVDGNIVMNPGKYMIEIYATLSSISPSYSTEGDPDAMGIIHSLAFNHPGNSQEIRDFLQNNLNENLGVIVQQCDSDDKVQYGTRCHPLQIQPAGVDDENQIAQQITVSGTTRTRYWPATYEGTLTLETVTGTAAADDATPSVANGSGQYQLTDNSVATTITSLDDAVDGGVYTLLGSGGSNPSDITGGDFILRNGTAWNALAGTQITFQAIKDGASSFKFVEQSRA